MGCPSSLLFRRGKSTKIVTALAMFARGAGARTEAQAGGTLLRVDVELDARAGAGGVTEAVACSVSIISAARRTCECSVLFASSLSLYPFADCILSSRDLQLRVWVLVALGTFVDAILFSSLNDGVLSFVVKMKPKRVSTDMVIRRANYSRDQGVGQEPRF